MTGDGSESNPNLNVTSLLNRYIGDMLIKTLSPMCVCSRNAEDPLSFSATLKNG